MGDFTRPNLYYASLKFTQPAKRKEITKTRPDGMDAVAELLFCDDNVATLDGARQVGPLDCDITEVHWNTGAHQRVRFIADVKVQVRLRGIAR